jgi:uncharacterized protein
MVHLSYSTCPCLSSNTIAGGDVNITDEDGDTPLYTVENIETATWLVDHGAIVSRVNAEGVSVGYTRLSFITFFYA